MTESAAPAALAEELAVHLRETLALAELVAQQLRHPDDGDDAIADLALLARALGQARRRARAARAELRARR